MRSLFPAIAIFTACSALATPPPFPQPNPGDQRILVPFAAHRIRGALGTVWSSRLTVYNGGTKAVALLPRLESFSVQPGQTRDPAIQYSSMDSVPGIVMYAPRDSSLAFEAVLFQENPAYDTEEVAFPVVREGQLFTGAVQLIDVPTDSQHRVQVRIFDLDFRSDAQYRVRNYGLSASGADVLLNEAIVSIHRDDIAQPDVYNPGRGDYRLEVPFEVAPKVRIEILPLSSNSHFWAAASITDNRTQHVTLRLPQTSLSQ